MNNAVICVYPPEADKSAKICVLFNLNANNYVLSVVNRTFMIKEIRLFGISFAYCIIEIKRLLSWCEGLKLVNLWSRWFAYRDTSYAIDKELF